MKILPIKLKSYICTLDIEKEKDIVDNADAITIEGNMLRLFTSEGKGLWISRQNANFKGFVERQLESGL